MGEIASPTQLRMSFARWALVCVPLVVLLGMASGSLSGSGYGNPWFDALKKPAIMPPGWLFGVAWTILYTLQGIALAMVLNARGAQGRPLALAAFAVQLALNLMWSPLFFAMHKILAAFWLILAILALAAVSAWLFGRIRRWAGLLMLPYLAWLSFASVLNWQYHALNPDDGRRPAQAAATIEL